MTKIAWDAVGTRRFEAGVDHAVLYFFDYKAGRTVAVPWNGITAVDDTSTSDDAEPVFLDGVQYSNRRLPFDYSGKITAFTYPDEFTRFDGVKKTNSGIHFHGQEVPEKFGLSYRTQVGNDILSTGAGYKIHMLYNLTAVADSQSFKTNSNVIAPVEFSWTITGLPEYFGGMRPTAHVSINTLEVDADIVAELEVILYGTDTTTPRLPNATDFNRWG